MTMRKYPLNELESQELFEIYWNMGANRSLEKLVEQIKDTGIYANLTPSTIYQRIVNLSGKYHWQLKLQERAKMIADTQQQIIEENIKSKIKKLLKKQVPVIEVIISAFINELNEKIRLQKKAQEEGRPIPKNALLGLSFSDHRNYAYLLKELQEMNLENENDEEKKSITGDDLIDILNEIKKKSDTNRDKEK